MTLGILLIIAIELNIFVEGLNATVGLGEVSIRYPIFPEDSSSLAHTSISSLIGRHSLFVTPIEEGVLVTIE